MTEALSTNPFTAFLLMAFLATNISCARLAADWAARRRSCSANWFISLCCSRQVKESNHRSIKVLSPTNRTSHPQPIRQPIPDQSNSPSPINQTANPPTHQTAHPQPFRQPIPEQLVAFLTNQTVPFLFKQIVTSLTNISGGRLSFLNYFNSDQQVVWESSPLTLAAACCCPCCSSKTFSCWNLLSVSWCISIWVLRDDICLKWYMKVYVYV